MIGIKGVGMTMLAQFFAENGVEITGSDVNEKFMTDKVLEKIGASITEKFDINNIPKDTDLIIYSTSYNKNTNIEVATVLTGKTKVLTYAEALGEVFNQKYGIAVTGSHGKTTTSAWLGYVLKEAGKNPNVLVGASVPQFNGAALVSKSDYMIIEADEYQNKFKSFQPKGVLLNNIDFDHPDFFKSQDDYNKVFIDFIKKIPKKGFLVANYDDPIIKKIAQVNCIGKVITYAINESADYVAYDIKQADDKQFFKVKLGVDDEEDNELGDFSIGLIGKHNILNALAVIATCIELDVDLVEIRRYLEDFKGTARRMEIMGDYRGAKIIDDYAHHPTEIKTTLAGVKQLYKDKNIKVVFHPHTFTRTKAMINEFAESFNDADEIIVLDIYGSAREEHGGISSEDLVNKIKKQGKENVKHIATLKECENYLRENIERNDIVVLMGAGDVFRIGENLVK